MPFQPAGSDTTADARYTHKTAASPGGPGGDPTTPTNYPKWVKNGDGEDVVVQDPDEEKAVAKPTKEHDAKGEAKPMPEHDAGSKGAGTTPRR